LCDSEEGYRTLVENGLQAIVVHWDETILYANPALAAMFGYATGEELVGRNLFETLSIPEDEPALRTYREARMRGEDVPTVFSWRGARKDGRHIWVSAVGSRVVWQGRPAVVAFVSDVTERTHAEQALRSILTGTAATVSKEFFPSLVRCLAHACGTRIAFASELQGPDRAQLLSFWDGDFRERFSYPLADTPCALVVRDGKAFFPTCVQQLFPKDKWLVDNGIDSYLALVMTAPDGTPVGHVGVMHDGPLSETAIVEPLLRVFAARAGAELGRLRAEEALKESEAFLRMSQSVSKVGSWQWDLRTNQVRWSDAMFALYGISSEQFTGTLQSAIASTHPDDLPAVQTLIQNLRAGGEGRPIEYRVIKPGGEVAHLWGHGEVIRDHAGTPVLVAGTVMDIGERKRAEDERRRLEAQIQHAQKLESIGVLAGGIAHDFNNLLTAVLGHASLALMQLPEESLACPMLREIETAAQRAAELTQQLLAYAGKGAFLIRPLRLDKLVHEMTKLLHTVVSKKAVIELNLEPAMMVGDATQIRQVVMNLITNASEALEGNVGVIRVATGVRHAPAAYLRSPFLPEELPAGDYAYVEVEDDGCGMSEQTLARIFDPFFTTKFKGRGLGLAAVLGIVRSHRSLIKVASTTGRGTMFEVLFPSAPAAPEATLPRPAPLPRKQGTVLVVDDEPSVRHFAQGVLESAGFRVRTAADGREALEVCLRDGREFAAVLLDLTMPRMDGLEVLRQLRDLGADLPVLVMSGYSEQDVASRLAGLGTTDVIQKPFHPRDLIAHLCQMLPAQGDQP
jgi:PAS domain S-box-containing protein